MKISKNSTIYVLCPANSTTGGPELLHQLVFALNSRGFQAFIYYFDRKQNIDPVADAYKIYQAPWVDVIEDSPINLLIVPEVNTDELCKYQSLKKIIWWLSVDNYFTSLYRRSVGLKLYLKKAAFKWGLYKRNSFNFHKGVKNLTHFAQSAYAIDFLKKNGISEDSIYYLSDYLNESFLENQSALCLVKKNIVAYNPKKGIFFTKMIMSHDSSISYVPIQGMSREEVSQLLATAKVYIDFGSHPGKDRIPREAAISGACVITGRSGSAVFSEDLPIPDQYKFSNSEASIPNVVSLIKSCFLNYDDRSEDFEGYRRFILSERVAFENSIDFIFQRDC